MFLILLHDWPQIITHELVVDIQCFSVVVGDKDTTVGRFDVGSEE